MSQTGDCAETESADEVAVIECMRDERLRRVPGDGHSK